MLDLMDRKTVDTNDLTWLSQAGTYVVRGCDRSDRARLSRHARKHGLRFLSSWDNGILTVDLRPMEV